MIDECKCNRDGVIQYNCDVYLVAHLLIAIWQEVPVPLTEDHYGIAMRSSLTSEVG